MQKNKDGWSLATPTTPIAFACPCWKSATRVRGYSVRERHGQILLSTHCPNLVFLCSHLYSEQGIPHHPIATTFWTLRTLRQWLIPRADQGGAQHGCPPAFHLIHRSLININNVQWNTIAHKYPSDPHLSVKAVKKETHTKSFVAGQTTPHIL